MTMARHLSSRDGFPMGEQWGNPYPTPPPSIKEAVRRHCMECSGQSRWTEECVSPGCSLFGYRPGNATAGRPTRKKRRITEEQKAKLAAGAEKARKARK